MVDRQGVGEQPTPALSDEKLGRMAQTLLNDPIRERARHPRYWSQPITGRRHTREEVIAALSLGDERRLQVCLHAWRSANPSPGRHMTESEKFKAYCVFIKKYKRWPSERDFRNWRTTALPPRSRYNTLGQLADTYITRLGHRTLTPQMVFAIPNLTTRRNVIAEIGIEELIKRSEGKPHRQDDFGVLWMLPTDNPTDARQMYVEVVNKTPQINEETGEIVTKNGEPVYDHYFLRVPPETQTAKDAVAWLSNVNPAVFEGFAAES